MWLPIILAVGPNDEIRARKLFSWMVRLGRQPARLVLLLDRRVPDLCDLVRPVFEEVVPLRMFGFDETSGGSAASDFSMRTGRDVFKGSPYLHTEPDAIPVCTSWVDKLMEGHGSDIVSTMSGAWTDSTEWEGKFLNAIAIYPVNYQPVPIPAHAMGSDRTNCAEYHPHLTIKGNPAFTHMYGYEKDSPLTVDNHVPTFPTQRDLDILKEHFPETVLFHRCQDCTLIERLAEKGISHDIG